MEHHLPTFFSKHPIKDSLAIALKMIHDQIECAKEHHHEDPDSKEYLKYLKKAGMMISDIFIDLNEDHTQY